MLLPAIVEWPNAAIHLHAFFIRTWGWFGGALLAGRVKWALLGVLILCATIGGRESGDRVTLYKNVSRVRA